MIPFKLLFVFVFLANFADLVVVAEEDISCDDGHSVVPGFLQMFHGVDLNKLDLLSLDSSSNGIQLKIFQVTCNKKRTWHDPNLPNITYSLPDQVETIATKPGGKLNIKIDVADNLQDFKKGMAANVGINLKVAGMASFSASGEYAAAKSAIVRKKSKVIKVTAFVSAVSIETKYHKEMKFTSRFQDYLDRLPGRYEDNPKEYEKFLDTFGTHYFLAGHFGGYLHLRVEIVNTYANTKNEREIKAAVKAKFYGIVGANANVSTEDKNASKDLEKNGELTFQYLGGRSELSKEPGALSNWWNSVAANPWLFGGQLENIEEIIANKTIKENIVKAKAIRNAKKYLEDLQETLTIGLIKLPEADRERLSAIEHYIYNPQLAGTTLFKSMDQNITDIFSVVTDIIDRATCGDISTRLDEIFDYIVNCKVSISAACKSPMHPQTSMVTDRWREYSAKAESLQNQTEKLNHIEVQNLLHTVNMFIEHENSTKIELCPEGDTVCKDCLASNADCYYSSDSPICTTKYVWDMILGGYKPKRVPVGNDTDCGDV